MVFATALAMAAAWLGTRMYLPFAERLQLVDTPNARSAHVVETPSSGGVAIVTALLFSLLLLGILSGQHITNEYGLMAVALAAICVLGAVDDRRPQPVSLRLFAFVAIAGMAALIYADVLPFSGSSMWFALPVLTLALAWLYNLYNFMDGIDGLAAVQTILAASGIWICAFLSGADQTYLLLCSVIAGSYAGFLWFNWPPAQLFMGDAGSLSAGFLLGWLGLWGVRDGYLAAAVWIVLLSPFLLDASLTLLRRALAGERITQAHSQHVYQRLARHFGGHRPVVLGLVILHGAWLIPLAIAQSLGLVPTWTLIPLGLFPQLFLIAKWWRLQ